MDIWEILALLGRGEAKGSTYRSKSAEILLAVAGIICSQKARQSTRARSGSGSQPSAPRV